MLNLERLRVLQAVARHGSVTAAAAELHVTTSAVSQQLARLERESGTTLVERSGRGIRLTDSALLLAGHASAILAMAEEAQADVDAQAGAVAGRLVLACLPTATRGLAAPALRQPGRRAPGAARRADRGRLQRVGPGPGPGRGRPGHRARLVERAAVRARRADPDPAAGGPGRHRRAGRPSARPAGQGAGRSARWTWTSSAPGPWICGTPGTSCHDWLTFTLRSAHLEPRIAHTANEYATQLALVAAGLGVAVMPRLGRGQVPAGVHMIAVRPSLRRNIYALWRSTAARRPAISATLAALREAAGR